MNELQIHANEVRNCYGCYARVAWLTNCYNGKKLVNVPDDQKGSWLTVDSDDRHDCPRKDRLAFLKEQKARRQ